MAMLNGNALRICTVALGKHAPRLHSRLQWLCRCRQAAHVVQCREQRVAALPVRLHLRLKVREGVQGVHGGQGGAGGLAAGGVLLVKRQAFILNSRNNAILCYHFPMLNTFGTPALQFDRVRLFFFFDPLFRLHCHVRINCFSEPWLLGTLTLCHTES